MADVYGIRITPDDGGKQIILDGSARFISYLGYLELNGVNRTRQVKSPTPGASQLIIPRNLIRSFVGVNGPSRFFYIKSYSLSSSGVFTYEVGGHQDAQTSQNAFGFVDTLSVDGGASLGSSQYGIRIRNGSDFLNLNDTTMLGFVTYRAVVNINGSWTIPSDVVAKGNYVCFVRFSGGDRTLYLERGSNRIDVYGPGGVSGGAVNGVQIVIVSCGFSPELPASGYGMVIRNAAGANTFTSKYPPVMWRGAAYNFPGYENQDTSDGEVLQWISPSLSMAQPMIPLCSIGSQSGAESRSDATWKYRPIMYAGFKMDGYQVSCARGPTVGEGAKTLSPKAMQVGCSIPCIDAIDYF